MNAQLNNTLTIEYFPELIKYRKTTKRPAWPVIILRTPKGWTGPKEIDGKQIEGSFRAHQVPIQIDEEHKENLELLEAWLRSYKPEELFDKNGTLIKELQELAPVGNQRMGANPHANGGILLKELNLPDFREYGIKLEKRGYEMFGKKYNEFLKLMVLKISVLTLQVSFC